MKKRMSGKYTLAIHQTLLLFFLLLCFTACEHSQEMGPRPLEGFFEKVTALVTTTVRSRLRDHLPAQKLLRSYLPSFEKAPTLNHLMEVMKGIDGLKDLAYLIESDVHFELQKPEHYYEKVHFNSQDIQRPLVGSVLAGMKRALEQLQRKGRSDEE